MRNRKIYISNELFSLAEYITDVDARDNYLCWQDIDTQKGYNYKADFTFEEYLATPKKSRFEAVIIRNSDFAVIGVVSLSPEWCAPDLAIMLYKQYRGLGYSEPVFKLALEYCFDTFALSEIYAGCYESNLKSLKMLKSCGFVPHPEGNCEETHFLDGTTIVQLDFVKYRDR